MPYFSVVAAGRRPSQARDKAILVTDEWDDWFQYSTMYYLVVFDAAGLMHEIGNVKIGEFGMRQGQRRPNLPVEFDQLDDTFFSLGQDDSYYEALNELDDAARDRILVSLKDVVVDEQLFERALREPVTGTSLLRSVSQLSVRGQFRRLVKRHARLTSYDFTYTSASKGDVARSFTLSFRVEPESQPPTNIHVIIGRNGVGKTRILRHMSRALLQEGRPSAVGVFTSNDGRNPTHLFANLVSVTFSAFDPFEPLPERKDASRGLRYSYIGLQQRKTAEGKVRPPKSYRTLGSEFVNSVKALGDRKVERWHTALELLETDPLFREAEVSSLALVSKDSDWEIQTRRLFDRLSSGHKIVLLTMTRLVETVEEKTIVLVDEPEAHLHPPLLSAFIRALSSLLVVRNGVAILATHSPVVLQEVPRGCVWKLRRTGAEANAERPEVETFGENVGILTREAFGFEVTDSGFHKMLREAVDTGADYESIVDRFTEQLGAEARAIVRGLTVTRDDRQL